MQGMNRLNIIILDGAFNLTHWIGSPAAEGGELAMVDMSATNGPPTYDFDNTGQNRAQLKFNLETKIMGSTLNLQETFMNQYQVGKAFKSPSISGLPRGLDWVITKANVSHNDKNEPSVFHIELSEVGPTGTAPVGSLVSTGLSTGSGNFAGYFAGSGSGAD